MTTRIVQQNKNLFSYSLDGQSEISTTIDDFTELVRWKNNSGFDSNSTRFYGER